MNEIQVIQFWSVYHLEGIIYLISSFFAVILCLLSILAYRKSVVPRLKYAIFAFGMLSIYTFYEFLEAFINLEGLVLHALPPILMFFGLIFFFISILKKK